MAVEKVTYIIEGVDKLSPKLNKANKSATGLGSTFASLGPALAIGAIVGGISKIINVTANFEKSMSNVKALTGATGEEFKSLEKLALDLGAKTEFSASQASDAMGNLAMAGLTTGQIMDSLPATLALASAGSLDLAQTADIATNIMSGFGLEAKDMGKISDVMAKTFTKSNTDLTTLGESFKFVAPIASSLGFQFNETSAALGALGSAGLKGTVGGNALKNVMAQLASPTAKASKLFDKYNISTRDASGGVRSLSDVIGQFQKAGAGGEEILEGFGKLAGGGFLALMKTGEEGLAGFTEALENAGGTAKRIAETKLDNFSGSMTKMGSAIEGAIIRIGKTSIGGFRKVVDGITKVISFIGSNFSEVMTMMQPILENLKAPFIILFDLVNELAKAFGFAGEGGMDLRDAFNILTTVIKIITIPLKITVFVLKTLADAFIFVVQWLEKTFGLFSGFVSLLDNTIRGIFGFAKAFMNIFNFIGDIAKNTFGAIGDLIQGVVTFDFEKIKGGLSKIKGNAEFTGKLASVGFASGFENGLSNVDLFKKKSVAVSGVTDTDTKLITQAVGGARGGAGAGGGATRGKLGADVGKVQGSKMTNIKISINNLIETMEIQSANLDDTAEQIKDAVTRALLTAVNDANIIHG